MHAFRRTTSAVVAGGLLLQTLGCAAGPAWNTRVVRSCEELGPVPLQAPIQLELRNGDEVEGALAGCVEDSLRVAMAEGPARAYALRDLSRLRHRDEERAWTPGRVAVTAVTAGVVLTILLAGFVDRSVGPEGWEWSW